MRMRRGVCVKKDELPEATILVCATRSPADWGPGTVQAQVVYTTQALPRVRLVSSPRNLLPASLSSRSY